MHVEVDLRHDLRAIRVDPLGECGVFSDQPGDVHAAHVVGVREQACVLHRQVFVVDFFDLFGHVFVVIVGGLFLCVR